MPYPDDPRFRDSALALFDAVWPGIRARIERARRWRADWFEVSTPFSVWEAGRMVAHVGVIAMPLRVEGVDVTIGGIHAVCTHPEHRSKGHVRTAMERALTFAGSHFETTVLWSEKVALYERFGFRPLKEPLFRGAAPRGERRGRARKLSVDSAADLALIKRLLAGRAALSNRLSTREPGWHFLIDLSLWPEALDWLYFEGELDALVVAEVKEQTLRLYDVVAPRLPSLDALVAHLGLDAEQVELYFTPDGLSAAGLEPAERPDEDVLMVRGPFLADPSTAALSPMTRC